MENLDPRAELRRLESEIKSATELAQLKPLYFRLSEIIKAYSGDFDVWVAGNDIKQLLVARGTQPIEITGRFVRCHNSGVKST